MLYAMAYDNMIHIYSVVVVVCIALTCLNPSAVSPWADIDVCFETACERVCSTHDGIYRCSCNPDMILLYDGISCRSRGKKRKRSLTLPMSRPVQTGFHHAVDGLLVYIPDKQTATTHDPERALHSLPDGFVIKESSILGAGLGVFTEKEILAKTLIGPHRGVKVTNRKTAQISGYSWAIKEQEKVKTIHYIDGGYMALSNWLRYINTPSSKTEKNLEKFQYKGGVYYRVTKHILPGDELLVWYGNNYARYLGLVKTVKKIRLKVSSIVV